MSRKRAAAVPASKVSLKKIYAVERDGVLTRFQVERVSTHRIAEDGSPHDYKSEVTGRYIMGLTEKGYTYGETVTLAPNAILGEYDQYKVLREQKEAEEAKREAESQAKKAKVRELMDLLYRITGLKEPIYDENRPRWNQERGAFREDYFGVDIEQSGVEPLLVALKKLVEGEPIVKREVIDVSEATP